MIARAPGKVVLSGAYAVLEGAPALVAAIDRYAVADARRTATQTTPEVEDALGARGITTAPWFDARALRDERSDRKLGLGSSAAILVASLAAIELVREPALDDATLATRIFGWALDAHRSAQRGGSGIDVAASTFGGVLRFQRRTETRALPETEAFEVPSQLVIEVWSSPKAASTAVMLASVAAARQARPREYRAIAGRLASAAEKAAAASDPMAFIDACRDQLAMLGELGELAGVPIVTPEVRAFDRIAGRRGAVVLPSGAGGGDVALWMSTAPAGVELGRAFGLIPLPLSLGARGVHADPAGGPEAAPSNTTAGGPKAAPSNTTAGGPKAAPSNTTAGGPKAAPSNTTAGGAGGRAE